MHMGDCMSACQQTRLSLPLAQTEVQQWRYCDHKFACFVWPAATQLLCRADVRPFVVGYKCQMLIGRPAK